MILATHLVVGAAAAELAGVSGATAFLIGWGSHYVLDAIPHWDYPLSATAKINGVKQGGMKGLGRLSVGDAAKIALDVLAGLFLVYLFLRNPSISVMSISALGSGFVLGALGGVFPDFIQFVYSKIKLRPFVWLQRVHHRIHSAKDLQARPWLGFSIQAVLVAAIIFLMNF